MKNFKNESDVAGQSNMRNAKSQKHDANLQKNSALYFQIGLILCLLVTYGLFEMKFEEKNYNLAKVTMDEPFVEVTPEVFQVEEIVNKKVKKQINTVVLDKDPIVKPDDFETPSLDILTEPEPYNEPMDADHVVVDEDPIDPIEIFSVIGVEQVPIYPGCESEKNNKGRLKCMSDNLAKLVQKKFDKDLASELGLSGIQKIQIVFKIDKSGNIIDVQTRAPHAELEREAGRVASQIPQMTPGKQREKPVTVQYALPIIFKAQ